MVVKNNENATFQNLMLIASLSFPLIRMVLSFRWNIEKNAHVGLMTRNTIKSDGTLISPCKLIDARIAPKVTMIEDWTSGSVGMFFSVIDSIMRR